MTFQMIPTIIIGIPLLALIGAMMLGLAWQIIKWLFDDVMWYRDSRADKAQIDRLHRQGYGNGIIFEQRAD